MPFDGEISGMERGLHVEAAASAGELPSHIHAHHVENKSKRHTDAHSGHGDGCHTALCCVMDYQQHLDHRSEENAFTSPTQVAIFKAHASRETLVPDRPPQHS